MSIITQSAQCLLSTMDKHGLLVSASRAEELLRNSRFLGEKLYAEIPLPFSTISDAEASLGKKGFRFRSAIPSRLAFGYEISYGLHCFLVGNKPDRLDAEVLAALFNLGISLFDHVCDSVPNGSEELSQLFEEPLLCRLVSEPSVHSELAAIAIDVANPRIRMLLQVIALFFKLLEDYARVPRDAEVWGKLRALFLQAYRAQIRSSGTRHAVPQSEALFLAVRQKSVLPFNVILQLIRVCNQAAEDGREGEADRLVGQIGTAFWLMDDLKDLDRDFKNGDANIILLRAGTSPAGHSGTQDSEPKRPRCEALVSEAAEEVCISLAAIVTTFRDAGIRSTAGYPFDELMLNYIAKWR